MSHLQGLGYNYINTPIITCADCEGAGEMFQVTSGVLPHSGLVRDCDCAAITDCSCSEFVSCAHSHQVSDIKQKDGQIDYGEDFFNKKAFLTVSGQLNAETFGMQ